MKTIAFYLPQFHTIPENDEWWGKGYTEWTAVKKAKPLYEGHYQPKIPLENNYYNLLEKSTIKWQAELMKKYEVDGLCFYHYYFKNGRKILEKPAENLLEWNDIDLPFCFSWANETWARTWSAIGIKNVWNSIEEQKCESMKQKSGILLMQEYGAQEDWKIHFNYLLPFFRDARYIKHNNAPIFIIHRADVVSCLPQMMELWNEMAKKEGFDGIYFIGTNAVTKGLNAYIRQEANYSDIFNSLKLDYDDISDLIIKNALCAGDDTYLCGVPAYDDTPRRGTGGKVIDHSSPKKFYEQMKSLYTIAYERKHDYIFINAWNEWGEGMYVEPDTRFGYGYLEALKSAMTDAKDMTMSSVTTTKQLTYSWGRQLQLDRDRYKENARQMQKMATMDNLNIRIKSYLDNQNINKIAVYGIGDVGKTFLTKLPEKSVDFLIDKKPDRVKSTYKVYGTESELPKIDLIIVCLPMLFPLVYQELRKITDANIVSLDQVLDALED